jgi:hypothetical protein
MPDSILLTLNTRRAEIETVIQRCLAEQDLIDTILVSYRKLGEIQLLNKESSEAVKVACPSRLGPEKTPYQSALFCRSKIIEANRPLTIDELYQLTVNDGFVIATPKPKYTLGARFRDHSKTVGFTFLPKHGWWLNHLPYPPASFYPNFSTGNVAMPVEGLSVLAAATTTSRQRKAGGI